MRNLYYAGVDVLGSTACVLGAVDITKIAAPSARPAIPFVEQLKVIEQQAIDKASGGWFSRALPGEQTRANNLKLISNLADHLRELPPDAKLSTVDWEAVRGASMRATSDWASVNEGRRYADAVFDQLLQDLADNAARVPGQLGTAAGKVAEGITGIPPWGLKVGLAVGVVGLSYVAYKIAVAAAPAVAGAYLGGRR